MIQKCSSWIVLREFLINPMKQWHIRQLSRVTHLATTSVKLHLKKLSKEGLVSEKDTDIFKHYESQFDNEKFRFYKKIDTLLRIQDSGIVEHIDEKCSPDTIVLFGSCAKGEDLDRSDMDIYVQSKERLLDLKHYEKSLKRKIQLFFAGDINKLPKELRNNILNGIKLEGYLKVF